jgi:very-short-patch-repair endonuclease
MANDAVSLPAVDVTLDYAHRVNFAFQQNAIPVIRRIELRNHSGSDLHQVVFRFSSSPEWARNFEQRIDLIPGQSDHALTDVPVELNLDYLASLSDRVRGELRIEVLAAGKPDGEPEPLLTKTVPVEVYAFDEWTGLASLPEILAAFVTPNVAIVEQLLSRASDLLGETTGSSAVNGYQDRSKKRVYEILGNIFRAVREQGIRYSNPPASFETTGQRIRFCEQIMRSKLATCLDLCLLFAALLEQAGLRPLILLHEGHAYTGCWLIPESLPEPTCDDLQSIRKRVELEEILLFETTLACDGQKNDFEASAVAARRHLGQDDIFQNAIDIHCSRATGIRPLPLKREEEGVDLAVAAAAGTPLPTDLPPRPGSREFAEEIDLSGEPVTPQGRIDHWKQQLLDLTLRNRLLNFRETKQTIPLICPDPEHLEDQLAADETFHVREQSKLMAGLDPRSFALQERQFAEDPLMIHLTEELQAKRLRSSLTETELSRRLLDLYRRTRMEMEESGVNTLYLALGFLEWRENGSERTHRAPILLIPVKLERKSAQHGFRLKRYDEDALINVTLLELLKRDFELEVPGVNPPPDGEQGVDVARVFRLFQQAVKEMQGWEVHREVWVAQFSFNKFLLWKDLHDRVTMLTRNPVVDHLVNRAGQPFLDEVEDVREEDLDDRVRYHEIFCPVSADSSQLASIVAASQGKNLVLHGPPGTGKSQTITNLISHCLALGKRVLFVAEKRAALEVVHRRLSQIGLGPFCLELHSNKSGKADVLRQFGEALDFANEKSPAEWDHLATKLEASRAELNDYVRELHRRYPNGMSAYQGYTWLIAHATDGEPPADLEPLRIDGIESHSRTHFEELQQLCDDLQIRGHKNRLPREAREALKPFGATSWTPEWEDQAMAAAGEMEAKTAAMEQALQSPAETLAIDPAEASRDFLSSLVDLCRLLIRAPTLSSAFVEAGDWATFRSESKIWIQAGRRRDSARAKLKDFDLAAILALDLRGLTEKHDALASQGGLLKSIRIWFLLRPVRAARLKGAPGWRSDEAPEFFATATELSASHRTVAQASDPATARLGNHWSGGEANWDKIEGLLQFGDNLHATLEEIAGDNVDRLLQLRAKAGQLLTVAADLLAPGRPAGEKFSHLDEAWQELSVAEKAFRQILLVNEAVPLKSPGHLARLRELCDRLRSHRRELQSGCRWQQSYQQAEKAQLDPLLRAVEQEILPLEKLREAFERSYRENFIRRLITLSKTLRDFWGEEHQKRIAHFNDLDNRYTTLTAQTVRARLAGELPRARREDCPRNTELGILQRERTKKARHKPVRKLLSEIPSIAPKLKPCFLMSPLSVAQYLDAGQDNFDIVVFDEASQIPVWDAVGAIARGRQVIIVGDPRQLPPTNFFGRVDADEDAIDDGSVADLESILDECLGSGLQTYYLRWHYRSRREGLIAFSNRHYYENQLHTFPAPDAANVGVRLVPVPEGFYDKGKSRTNQAEAEAIKAEVIRRLTDPNGSHQSIGIVTFSQAQQTLVLDKLDEARREHPKIERYFGEEVEEPVFVKNLENVQGDERDVILFSVCYGPDEAGRVSMNFGPLNRIGGERRLNVAVTRAKHEIVVFSTLRSEEIDLARTRAKGAEHLKAYLEYAERGPRALIAATESARQEPHDAVFESEVAEFLRLNGFEVHTEIGCSGYRIDLAVLAPDEPRRYLLGIECDGSTYHRAATARDRDRLRQAVLEGLGWHIHRIWSTDWWRDREKAAAALLAVVREAARAFESEKAAPTAPGQETSSAGSDEAADEGNALVHEPAEEEVAASNEENMSPAAADASNRERNYPVVTVVRQSSPDAFYEPESAAVIDAQIHRIIAEEGPVTEALLLRRLIEEWQFARTGPRIRETLIHRLPADLAKTRQNDQRVFWPDDFAPSAYRDYRIPTDQPESKRRIEEIPLEELQNAILDILEHYLSYPRSDLVRDTARKFGFTRMSDKITAPLETALTRLIEAGSAIAENGVVKLAAVS